MGVHLVHSAPHSLGHRAAPRPPQPQRRKVGDQQAGAGLRHKRGHGDGGVSLEQEEGDAERLEARRHLAQAAQHEPKLARPRVQVLGHLPRVAGGRGGGATGKR